MLKMLFKLFSTLAILLLGASAHAGMQEAKEAYKNKDYATAVQELRPLLGQKVAEAQYYIGLIYDYGNGVPPDHKQASGWYLQAAQQGYAPAQNNLGVLYERGIGIVLSNKAAASWYLRAAEQGYAPAQFNLGLIYYVGRSNDFPRNSKAAASWFQKAADQGYALAQNSLGSMYENGQGVPVSLVQAYKWYSLAALAGHEAAPGSKKLVEARLAPEMLEEAQALIREWQASHK